MSLYYPPIGPLTRRATTEAEPMKDPHKYVAGLLAVMTTETVAAILNEWLSVWDNPEEHGYTSQQATDIEGIHAALCGLRPDAVDVAQGR